MMITTPQNVMFTLLIVLASYVAALALTGMVRRALLKNAVLDIPNDRSSHKIPVPRGGGWALVIILVPVMIVCALTIDGGMRHAGLIAAVFLLAGISWLDDRGNINAMVRLGVHILAACLGASSFGPTDLVFGGWFPLWLDRAVMIMGWAWFINLYNFMDGIDGITATETMWISGSVLVVLSCTDTSYPFVALLAMVLAGVAMGFFVYNKYPAQIFLGDVGSVPLGFLVGFCLISLAVKGFQAAAVILPLYYLADSGITIAKRALRGQKIWQAHREHFYQRSALGAGRHDQIVKMISNCNGGLMLTAIASTLYPLPGLAAALAIVAVLLQKMHKIASQSEAT